MPSVLSSPVADLQWTKSSPILGVVCDRLGQEVDQRLADAPFVTPPDVGENRPSVPGLYSLETPKPPKAHLGLHCSGPFACLAQVRGFGRPDRQWWTVQLSAVVLFDDQVSRPPFDDELGL